MPGSFTPSGVPKPHYVSDHFTIDEFARKPRPPEFPRPAPYPQRWVYDRLVPLVVALETIRKEFRRAIKIGSGYRDPGYNTYIKGARYSQHCEGRAADITIKGVSPKVVHDTILRLYNEGKIKIGGLGQYPGFVHVDVRPTKKLVRWSGSRKEG